jgi:hypothetical protein
MDELITTLAHAAHPPPALQRMLQYRFGLTEGQLQVLEQAAAAVAQERRQRQELQQLNAALRQLEQDKNPFTQMLVHDLKNPNRIGNYNSKSIRYAANGSTPIAAHGAASP